MTIEERATRHFRRIYKGEQDNIYLALVEIATEQDRIARAEEQERCIKAAQNAFCFGLCSRSCARHMNGSGVVNCSAWMEFIKSMEGGNNGN